MKSLRMFLAAFMASILATTIFAQAPPESPDCWKCTEKYCWEEATGFLCPNLPCKWEWMPHPTDPNLLVKSYYCNPPDNSFGDAVSEVVNGSLSYNDCVQQGVGRILTGHKETEVACSVLYKCGCSQDHYCIQGEKIRDLVRKNSQFRELQPGNICKSVEATPGTPGVTN